MPDRVALVTGSAGFIGFHVCKRLLAGGYRVVGVDALTDYYDVDLKMARQRLLMASDSFSVVNDRIESRSVLADVFALDRPSIVIHLAAQAGVRYSIENPRTYLESNICGTFELLEAARANPPEHLLLASTSSAYGASVNMPYQESDRADYQLSFYAATKKATENLAHSYSHLFALPVTAFRFFTVYGPWGRPDMALFKFTKAILNGEPISVFNQGNMKRDFTYVDDVVHAIMLLIDHVPPAPGTSKTLEGDNLSPVAPFRLLNIGNSSPVELSKFIDAIELATQRTAKRELLPMQAGDVPATWADTTLLSWLTGYCPETTVQEGVQRFVEWFRDYYKC